MLKKYCGFFPDLIKMLFLMRPYWKRLSVFVVINTVNILLWLLFPLLTKVLIDDVFIQKEHSLLYPVLLATFSVAFVVALLKLFNNYYMSYTQHAMATQINFDMCKHIFRFSFSFWDRREVAELLSRLRDASTSRRVLIKSINAICSNLVYIVIVPGILFYLNWKLSLLVLAIFPCTSASLVLFARPVKRHSRVSAEMRGRISSQYQETFSGIREIKALGTEGLVLKRLKRLYLRFRKVDMKMRVFGDLQNFVSAVIRAIGTLLYMAFGAHQVMKGQMTIGELTAFTTFIGYLYTPLTSLAGLLLPIQEILVHTQRFNEIYELEPGIHSPDGIGKQPEFNKDIVFNNVGFLFDAEQPILHSINLRFKAGTTTAIVGRTGSGKSSLLNLIPRFYDPVSGAIFIDDIDLRKISLTNLRSNIAYVMQNPFIFTGTLFDNLTGGSRAYTMDQVVHACRCASAYEFICNLPQGMDTLVGEKGISLSGGERQRIALARALLTDRPILIMDEPTAGIDAHTETSIHTALKDNNRGKTTIMVTHNLESIKNVDRIVVMNNGKIVESGDHDTLMGNDREYCRLYLNNRLADQPPVIANQYT